MSDRGTWLDVTTGDGRTLEVVLSGPPGPPGAMPIVFHNGTPSAAWPFPALVEAAGRQGLVAVTSSRPGYARSTPLPGRRVADVAADTAAVLDALGATSFVALGWSGGGPHALACGALLGGRCRSVATIGGVAPYRAEGLDWMAGMGDENLAEFGCARAGTGPLTAFLEGVAPTLAGVQASDVAAALGDLVPDVDKAALTGEYAAYLATVFRRAVSTGIAGWRDDDLAFVGDWGFDLGAIAAPVAIWQGAQDRMVPADHGPWLAGHIPGAIAHLLPGEGHLSLCQAHLGAIVADLVASGRPP